MHTYSFALMDCLHCCSMHSYSIGIWIWCCLFCVLSYTSLLPQNYRFLWQLTIHINTTCLLICYPHPPLIHYQFGLILTFVFLLMIWPQFSFFFFDLFDFCLGFLLLIIYLIYWFHFIKFLLSNLIFLSIFMTAFFMITPVETSEILSGMLRLVFLGFRYAWSQNKKEHALSSLLALYTTADNAPDLLTFFSSSLHFKYPLLNLSKKFRAVSPKITKNKEDLICAPTSLPFWTQADSYWHLLKLDQQLFTE